MKNLTRLAGAASFLLAAPAGAQSMQGMTMPGMDMPAGMQMPPGMQMPGMDTSASGTDLSPGSAAPPPVPTDHYADRFFPAATMARARAAMMHDSGRQTVYQALLNLAEYQIRGGSDGYRWDGEGFIGGDLNRLWIKSEGEGSTHGGTESAEVQALYSRAIGPYYNLQAGLRQDIRPIPARSYATVGVEGLAPLMFQTEAALFLSTKGDLLGRLEGWYDQRITQRLILQPRVELNFAAQNVPEDRFGAGLVDAELGLRLRYEIRREIAPYIGVSYERKAGLTAGYARERGESVGGTSFVFGIRTWF